MIKNILIVGGGTSGWMTAAMLSKLLNNDPQRPSTKITLVESKDIGTIGVGEATIPAIKRFNQLLGINEAEFLAATQGTFKLGIQFNDWGKLGESYVHGFGKIGRKWDWLSFYQYWLHVYGKKQAKELDHYSINSVMALQNKFCPAQVEMQKSPLAEVAHAYHFDAGLYANFLRRIALEHGVEVVEGKIVGVKQHPYTQLIDHVELASGQTLSSELFIDCSGMQGLLIEKHLNTGFEDWSHWLPCDSALAVASKRDLDMPSFTRAKAHGSGWQWKIPLQHRTGNGHVYSSMFISDQNAEQTLLQHLDTKATSEVKQLRFRTGKRRKAWNKNCVAIGLSAGFLEPLESTSLYLVQTAILRLIKLFPDGKFLAANSRQYNEETDFEIERIRDFIIAHYKVTTRSDSEFWRYCQHMEIPPSLEEKLSRFASYGRVHRDTDELFREESWVKVLIGQGLFPRRNDPLVALKQPEDIKQFVAETERVIETCLSHVGSHKDFIARYCAGPAG